MQGLLGMTEEHSASQINVSLFKMYYQYTVDTVYVYYTYEHIFVLHSTGMYHSASKWWQTGHKPVTCFVCYEVTEILQVGFFSPCAFKTMKETRDKNISIYMSPLRYCDAF